MDTNREYAAHQRAMMRADMAINDNEPLGQLAQAADIAGRISAFQLKLGAAAACAWSMAQFSAS